MSEQDPQPMTSTFFFPLRSNTIFYDSPSNFLSLIERVKQASLLYDKLVFESGLYSATIWPTGEGDFWIPSHKLSVNQIKSMREGFDPFEGQAALFVQAEGGEPIPLFSGSVIRRFYSEFHSVLGELNATNTSWITFESFSLTEYGKTQIESMQKVINEEFRNFVPNDNKYIYSRVLKNFCRDMVITSSMGAAASINGIYASPFGQKIGASKAPGFSALEVAVPNVSHLSWAEIVELRSQDAWVEFRKKLLTLEVKVKSMLPDAELDEVQYELSLHKALIEELVEELVSYQPKTGEVVGNVIMDIIVGLVPLPGASAAFTGLRGIGQLDKSKSSWIAAFLKMRQLND